MLEGLLEQETGLNPTEIMTDTAGASDLVFGLSGCWSTSFLHAWLMPVLRFSGEWTMMRLWRAE
ncbi:transposase [Klebsiella pneumoniae]|nr:transposase [Klebsiella pneumoniae]